MEETLRQLHLERLARRGIVRAVEIEESKVEDKMEETKEYPPQVVEEEEKEGCTVCLMPMENPYALPCGHQVCVECKAQMMTQNLGNGCVGTHTDTGIKVIKCPVCRREDAPTREELIAEIVRIRRGGHFSRIYELPTHRAMAVRVPAPAHNLPEVIPVLQPVIQHNQPAPAPAQQQEPDYIRLMNQYWNRDQPAPAPAPVPAAQIEIWRPIIRPAAGERGNWLRNLGYQPNRANLDEDHLNIHRIRFIGDNLNQWNIMRGHPLQEVREVANFLHSGQRTQRGWVCGQGANARFYHQQFFVPVNTEGNTPARRLCNNAQCNGTSRTARRCPRGCGQFICQRCGDCNNDDCRDCNI
jgi:hypothetical protein